MDHFMEILITIFCVFTGLITSITVSPNGNSPEIKMIGGIKTVDNFKGQIKLQPHTEQSLEQKIHQSETSLQQLALNERYRRLIPYMTFYYANNLTTPRTDLQESVEVEKVEIVEADILEERNQRQSKKIIRSSGRIIPRYQGNRLSHYNLASSNPTKIYYKDGVPLYENPNKVTPNYNPILPEYVLIKSDYNLGRTTLKPTAKTQPSTITSFSRKPYVNIYKPEDTQEIRYYLSDKEASPKYKLVPYEQTPPVKVMSPSHNFYEPKKPYIVSVLMPREQVYNMPKPTRPPYSYETINAPSALKKTPVIVTNNYYEKHPSTAPLFIENGFQPILNPSLTHTSKLPVHAPETYGTKSEHEEQNSFIDTLPGGSTSETKENEYPHISEDIIYKPLKYASSNTIDLAALLNSLQENRSIPKTITRENVGSSIRTLLQALNILNASPKETYYQNPILSTPTPFASSKNIIDTAHTAFDSKSTTPSPSPNIENNDDIYIPEEPYLAAVKNPSQNIDDYQTGEGSIQHFPLPVTSDEEGGTPGRPDIDYPILTTIPQTAFDCKTQRYKGFFADPETRCQVWHYCDLNGGQASFLCPNGTIFSQAGLTCDWWFNVKCASTTQLYVLNESLYKFILPHSPKFPEDFSGPLVDKYLTLKFKEMEDEFKKNKNKQTKIDKDETEDSSEKESDVTKNNENAEATDLNTVSEASVLVESVGVSGKVERLSDE